MKKLFTLLTLAGAFLVANAQTVNADFYVNYAEIAYKYNDLGSYTTISRTGSNFTINNISTKKFNYTVNEIKVLEEGIVTAIENLRVSNNDVTHKGLYKASNTTATTYGILNLSEGDVVEIGFIDGTTNKGITDTYHLSTPESIGKVVLNLQKENESTDYTVDSYQMTVTESGSVLFNLTGAYLAYIKINPVSVSDFKAESANVTSTSAEISVTYTATNVNDETTFTLYYKDQEDTDGEYTSVEATSTGGTISLSGLTAGTSYTYDIYLEVNDEKATNASTTVSFTTKSELSPSWSINYAEIAAENLQWKTSFGAVTEVTDQKNYILGSTDGIQIGSNSDNYKFAVYYNGDNIIPENDITNSNINNLLYRFAYGDEPNNTGLLPNGASNFGILNLKASDIVEIAYISTTGYDDTEAPSAKNLVNLTASQDQPDYTFNFDKDDDPQSAVYKVYRYTVNADGPVSIRVPKAYIAYIAVNPNAEDPEEGNITIEFGSDNIEGTVKEDGSIYAKTTGETARIYVRINGATENSTVKYKVEETFEGISLYSDTSDFNTASYDSDQQAHYIDLPKGEGTLTISYKKDDDSDEIVSKPIPYQIDFTTAVETIETANDEAVYFNINGVKVQNPERGVFIKVQGGKSQKVIL